MVPNCIYTETLRWHSYFRDCTNTDEEIIFASYNFNILLFITNKNKGEENKTRIEYNKCTASEQHDLTLVLVMLE